MDYANALANALQDLFHCIERGETVMFTATVDSAGRLSNGKMRLVERGGYAPMDGSRVPLDKCLDLERVIELPTKSNGTIAAFIARQPISRHHELGRWLLYEELVERAGVSSAAGAWIAPDAARRAPGAPGATARCPPWPTKGKAALRFPYGLSPDKTLASLRGCTSSCRPDGESGSYDCTLANDGEKLKLDFGDAEFGVDANDVEVSFTSDSLEGRVDRVVVKGDFDDCDAAAAAVAAAHVLISERYAKPSKAKVKKGPKFNTEMCADLMKSGRVYTTLETAEWYISSDTFYVDGDFVVSIHFVHVPTGGDVYSRQRQHDEEQLKKSLDKL